VGSFLRAEQPALEPWINALVDTWVQGDDAASKSGPTRQSALQATLSSVRARHPELPELKVRSEPASLLAEKARELTAPERARPAVDLLFRFAGSDVRMEFVQDELLLRKVDGPAEGLRHLLARQKYDAAMIAAIEAGHADAALLDTAQRHLQRATKVATGGVGWSAAIIPPALFAFEILRRAPDAVRRFEVAEKLATPAGKFYARAGLLLAGGDAILTRLPPLEGRVPVAGFDVSFLEEAQPCFEKRVASGEFAREIESTMKQTRQRWPERSAHLTAFLEKEAAALPALAPTPVGRVLNDEFSEVADEDLFVRTK
jgi:hypothetical protein